MRRRNRIGFDFRIGQQEDPALARSERIGENRSGKTALPEAAVNGALLKIQLVFRFPAPENLPVVHFEIGAVLRLHDGLVAPLRERFKALLLQQGGDPEQRVRHHIFLQHFDAVGGVLVVGGALFDSAPDAAELAECRTDHGPDFRHQQADLRIAESSGVPEADQIGAEEAEAVDDLLFECVHSRFFSFR